MLEHIYDTSARSRIWSTLLTTASSSGSQFSGLSESGTRSSGQGRGPLASALFTIKPGALRELHWHPKSEWQYYLGGRARMTVFASAGQAHTMDYKANDVGYVPAVAGHYLQNTGNDDMSFLALFKSSEFVEFSLDQWLRRLPVQMTQQHLRLSPTAIARIPLTRNNIF